LIILGRSFFKCKPAYNYTASWQLLSRIELKVKDGS
jgi:hypothetical protein